MNRRTSLSFLLLGTLLFLVNGDNYAAAPVLVDLAGDLHIDVQAAAYTVTAYMIFFGLFTLLFGPLSDRFGKTSIIKIAALGTALFSIVGAFAGSLRFLIVARAINGLFAAGVMPVTIALVGQRAEPENRQNKIGQMMGMMFLGGAMATLIGGLLAYLGSWRTVYGAYGILELVLGLILLAVLPPSPREANKRGAIWRNYALVLKNPDLIRTVSVLFLLGFAVLGSFAFSGKLVQESTGLNLFLIGLVLSSYGLGTVLGGRISGTVERATGDRFFLIAGLAGSAALALIFLLRNVFCFVPSFFLFGLAFVSLQSAFVTRAQMTNPALSGTIMALVSFMMVSSGAVGTLVNGFIASKFGLPTIYLVAAGSLLLIGVVAPFMVKRRVLIYDPAGT